MSADRARLAQPEAPTTTAGSPPDGAGEWLDGGPQPRTSVLLVDDNAENLSALSAVLETLRQPIVRAQSGEEALRCLLQDDFAVILLDVHMPGLDGFETARLIRDRERTRHTPIIFITGIDTTDTHIARGYSLGAVDYLFKPFDPDMLQAKVSVFVQLALQQRLLEHEIRQREQAEREIRLLNAELECRVRQRTRELEQANRHLAQADQQKDHWLATLSHELRNPLAAMLTALEVLRRTDGPARDRAMLALDRQLKHQVRLIEDLLDVSRIRRGKIELERKPVDLARVVREAAEDCRPAYERGNVTLELLLPPAPAWISGDGCRLAQVVTNVLANAAKFTGPGGSVTACLCVDGDVAQLLVRDTGVGIDREMLPRIFDAFTQVQQMPCRGAGGLGLGLALVKGIVELHGGTVVAESDGAGTGASFTIRLPLSPAGAVTRVVLIEDNRDAAETLTELLVLCGHQVELARDGAAGIELARESRPDVVLCDLGLPVVDGYEVARTLRQTPGLGGALLIAVSGYGSPQAREQALAAGFDHHLTKPVDFHQLTRLIGARTAS
jgi:signal transduction histidine kinase